MIFTSMMRGDWCQGSQLFSLYYTREGKNEKNTFTLRAYMVFKSLTSLTFLHLGGPTDKKGKAPT